MENKLYERDFKNGQLYGVGILYFENGNKKYWPDFKYDNLTGTRIFYDKKGNKEKAKKNINNWINIFMKYTL